MGESDTRGESPPKESLSETRRQFLEKEYLKKSYLVPPEVNNCLEAVSNRLLERFPGKFICLAVVGGMATGSNLLRKAEGVSTEGSDLDFFFVVDSATHAELKQMLSEVSDGLAKIGVEPCKVTRGISEEACFDLARYEKVLDGARFDLLSKPFECTFGNATEAQRFVLDKVSEHPQPIAFWEQIVLHYQDSLLMSHKSWGDFNELILREYCPKKLEKFDLPKDPADYHPQKRI